MKAVHDLAAYLCDHGPFECLLGFSVGAAVFSTLLLSPENSGNLQTARKMVRTAIFICGTSPQKWESLQMGCLENLKPGDVSDQNKIQIPTVHAYSLQDNDFGEESKTLVNFCHASNRQEVIHSAGHDVPKALDEINEIVKAIRGAVEMG